MEVAVFEFTQLPITRRPEEPVLACQLAPNLCVRLVDCTTHEGIPNVEVRLGNTDEERVRDYLDQGFGPLPSFRLDGKTYHQVARKRTNNAGWVCFSSMFIARRQKGDLLVFNGYALQVLSPGYGPVRDGAEQLPDGPAQAFKFTLDAHTVAMATLRAETPVLPPDFEDSIASLLGTISRVRIGVEQGANLGNQASALSLITNLRRVGYAGRIDVLTNPDFLPYDTDCTLRFTLHRDEGTTAETAEELLVKRLNARLGVPVQSSRRLSGSFANIPEYENTHRFPDRVYYTLSAQDLLALRDLPLPYKVTATPEPQDLDAVDVDVTTGSTEKGAEHILPLTVIFKLRLQSVSEPSITTKLCTLDPGYKTNPSYGQVAWVEQAEFPTSAEDDRGVVGMVGGHDFGGAPDDSVRRERLKTHSLLALQPYQWHPEDRFLQVAGGGTTRLCLPGAAAYFLDPVVAGAPSDFALSWGVGPTEAALLAAVVERARAKELTLMTAYGIHQAHDSSTETLLNNLAAGSLAAVAQGDDVPRKVVLFAVSKVDLGELLATPNATLVRAGDPSALAALEGLQDDHLLVVHAPPLPLGVFQLLVQTSQLPAVVEGANSSNLVQMLGKPYISVSTRYTPYVALPGDAGKAHEKLTRVTDHLNLADLRDQEVPLGELAAYFHNAAATGDAYGGYFAKVQAHLRVVSRDQLKLGLYRLARVLPEPRARPVIPPECAGHG